MSDAQVITSTKATNAATVWLSAKHQADTAAETLDNARKALLKKVGADGRFTEVPTTIGTVQVIEKDRRTLDVDAAGKRLHPSLFDKLTKVVIDIDAWDQALKD